MQETDRPALSCTECARRKVRCSKTFPCSSCVDRGIASSCRELISSRRGVTRRKVASDLHRRRAAHEQQRSAPGSSYGSREDASPSPASFTAAARVPTHARTDTASQAALSTSPHSMQRGRTSESSPQLSRSRAQRDITNDTVVTLEFLAHGRRNILKRPVARPQAALTELFGGQPSHESTTTVDQTPGSWQAWDTIFLEAEVWLLLEMHEQDFLWYHNVVHMPSFREQFERCTREGSPDAAWLALYYAMLATTLHHFDDEVFAGLGLMIVDHQAMARTLFDKSISYLSQAEFMSDHNILSIQTICILLQVAHNIDRSDFITVMLAAAIRIGQCLGIHRLGTPTTTAVANMSQAEARQVLLDVEIKKRAWWFLVRQDWLQIPFQNTHLIHPNQFNTPMPANCFDDADRMFDEHDQLVVQSADVYTDNAYTQGLNEVAVLIWRHQDRMYATGHPGDKQQGIINLHSQVMWADDELKATFDKLPPFLKPRARDDHQSDDNGERLPNHIRHQASVTLLSFAHKTLTIHRHFQIESFRDHRFAFTKMSCIAIAEKAIIDVDSWPVGPTTQLCLRLWTVITHLITCSVLLIFASIFESDNTLLYDAKRLKDLARLGRALVRRQEANSSIAVRGGKMLDALLGFDENRRRASGGDIRFDLEEVIAKVSEDSNEQGDVFTQFPHFKLGWDFDSWYWGL